MSEVMQRNAEEVEAIAEKLGLVCFFPESDELLIDSDEGELNEKVIKVLADNNLLVTDRLTTISKGGNKHIYLKLNRHLRGPMAAIALQACLSSDPVREALCVLRVLEESTHPVALFETKLMAKVVKKWREKCNKKAEPKKESIYDSLDIPY